MRKIPGIETFVKYLKTYSQKEKFGFATTLNFEHSLGEGDILRYNSLNRGSFT